MTLSSQLPTPIDLTTKREKTLVTIPLGYMVHSHTDHGENENFLYMSGIKHRLLRPVRDI